MQNKGPHKPIARESLERKHESQNPPIWGVLLTGCIVLLMVVFSLVTIRVFINFLSKSRPMERSQELGIITAPSLKPLERFPAPTLQVLPHDELLALRAREDQTLTNYGWADRTNRVVRIPIARAMELISQRGLPVSATNTAPKIGKSSLELIQDRSQKR
jgi:hypothetical protein